MGTGAAHTCVLLETGTLLCWGENARGQLGLGYASTGTVDYVGGNAGHRPAQAPRRPDLFHRLAPERGRSTRQKS